MPGWGLNFYLFVAQFGLPACVVLSPSHCLPYLLQGAGRSTTPCSDKQRWGVLEVFPQAKSQYKSCMQTCTEKNTLQRKEPHGCRVKRAMGWQSGWAGPWQSSSPWCPQQNLWAPWRGPSISALFPGISCPLEHLAELLWGPYKQRQDIFRFTTLSSPDSVRSRMEVWTDWEDLTSMLMPLKVNFLHFWSIFHLWALKGLTSR